MSYLRCQEPGWTRIGRTDASGRRSLWIRESAGVIELCSGREGDDSYVRLTSADPQWLDLEDVLSRARWAAELEPESDEPDWRYDLDLEVAELARDARSLMTAAIQAAKEIV